MAKAIFLADITGPVGPKGEGVANSLRTRPLSDLPSLVIDDWVGESLVGIYRMATTSTAATIIGRPLGSDGPAFATVEPIATGGSLVTWSEYGGLRRTFERIVSTSSANRTEWKRTDKVTRTVLHQLSMAGNSSLTDTEPTRHVRLPIKLFGTVDSWELVFKNFNDRQSRNFGALDFVNVFIAKRESDGNGGFTNNFAESPTNLGVPSRTGSGDSERYRIANIHFQLEANTEYLLSYAYTTPGGTPNHMGIGGSYLGINPLGVGSMSVSNQWSQYTPLDVYLKLEAAPETPFFVYPGSSSETGLHTDYPLRDGWGWRHAESYGAIPALIGQSGSALSTWIGASHYVRGKFSTIARADKVVGNPGSNDIYGGTTLAEMKSLFGSFALFVRRYLGDTFESADVFPRRTETAAIKGVREAFNAWLKELPDNTLVSHERSVAVEGADGLMRPEFDSGDGVHLNTIGQHLMAARVLQGGGGGNAGPRSAANIAALPPANVSNRGLIIFVAAENKPYYSNGTAWGPVATGGQGNPGPPGAGVPTGGAAGQVVRRNSANTTTEWATLDKHAVALGNVDNTADEQKPISLPQQVALNFKQNKLVEDPSDPGFYFIGG